MKSSENPRKQVAPDHNWIIYECKNHIISTHRRFNIKKYFVNLFNRKVRRTYKRKIDKYIKSEID